MDSPPSSPHRGDPPPRTCARERGKNEVYQTQRSHFFFIRLFRCWTMHYCIEALAISTTVCGAIPPPESPPSGRKRTERKVKREEQKAPCPKPKTQPRVTLPASGSCQGPPCMHNSFLQLASF